MTLALTFNAFLNPVEITRHACVDAGLLHEATHVAKADDSHLFPAFAGGLAHKRTTRVASARVFFAGVIASAQHRHFVESRAVPVLAPALVGIHNLNHNLSQLTLRHVT